jgi:hypothetical protein
MSIRSFFVRLSWKAAAVAAFVWGGSSASAADVTAPAAPAATVSAAPISVGEAGCASCQMCAHGAFKGHCDVCGKLLGSKLHKDKKAPYPVTLCPGACFGYFQTQWRKWDEVCPYPYLGIGPNTNLPTNHPANQPATGSRPGELGQPRPVDPKMPDPKMPESKKTGSLQMPPIPVAPVAPVVPTAAPNKFAR